MSTIAPSRYVPYGFARTNQLLVAGLVGETMEVWIGERTPRHALAELSRLVPMRLVTVRKGDPPIEVMVKGVSRVRGPAPVAAQLYEETPESSRRREHAAEMRRLAPEPALDYFDGRPTKRDRRQLDRYRRAD